MFPYIATEKDCVDEDGSDAECVICFEEFQAGDKMARLVCWCKFHEVFIPPPLDPSQSVPPGARREERFIAYIVC
jgi:hypothetical protein